MHVIVGSMSSPPAQISQVLAQMDRLNPKSRLSISWDPLPCHLQNGGDVGYIIQYSLADDSEVRTLLKMRCTSIPQLGCVGTL